MPMPRQLFIISHDAFAAITDEDVDATVKALREVDLYRLPYDRVNVRMQTDDAALPANPGKMLDPRFNFWQSDDGKWHSKMGPAHYLEFRNLNLLDEPMTMWCVHDGSDRGWKPYEIASTTVTDPVLANRRIADVLITLLATKNAIKETEHHKSARLGIGGKRVGSTRRYEYVTTITVPKTEDLEDDIEHAPTGVARAPHLRRGHLRRQPYGPGRSYVRTIFIEAMFVNADKEWVATRKAYNLGV